MRTWPLALLVIATLAGCADEPTPAAEPTETDVITDPTDYSYIQRDGSGEHIHDYWGGQDRITVVDGSDGCDSCTVSYGGDDGALIARLIPADGVVVPQGTGIIHIDASWDIQGTESDHGDIAVYVKSANDTRARFISTIQNGGHIMFNVTNDMDDPPHNQLSLWEFELRALPAPGNDQTVLQDFEGHIKAVAERTLTIPPWPPHPELWNGADTLTLHASTRQVDYQLEAVFFYFCVGCLGYHPPDDGLIVPYDAQQITVTLESDAPATIGLQAHGADTREYTPVEPDESDVTKRVWHLPIQGRADSPYAQQSLWELALFNDQPTPAKAWKGEYSISIVASK